MYVKRIFGIFLFELFDYGFEIIFAETGFPELNFYLVLAAVGSLASAAATAASDQSKRGYSRNE